MGSEELRREIYSSLLSIPSSLVDIVYQYFRDPTPVNFNLVRTFGKKGKNEGEFDHPHCISCNKDYILIGDTQRLQLFDTYFKFIRHIPSYTHGYLYENHIFCLRKEGYVSVLTLEGEKKSEFKIAQTGKSIAVNSKNEIFVSHPEMFTGGVIAVYSYEGKKLREWGLGERGSSEFFSMAINEKHLCIADVNRVHMFDHNGNFIQEFGAHGELALAIDDDFMYIGDRMFTSNLHCFSLEGELINQKHLQDSYLPRDMTLIKGKNLLLVLENEKHCVKVYE